MKDLLRKLMAIFFLASLLIGDALLVAAPFVIVIVLSMWCLRGLGIL